MSKSLGNRLLVSEVLQAGAAGRAALLPRRRALPLEHRVLTTESLREAETAFERIEGFVDRAARGRGAVDAASELPGRRSRRRMDDDLGVSGGAGRRCTRPCGPATRALADGDDATPSRVAGGPSGR